MGSKQLISQRNTSYITQNNQQIINMVFQSDPIENENGPSREMIIKTAKVGDAVVKVVNRCEDAKETKVLDLSLCSLMQVPEAVYFILRATEILKCNLSNNLISKITPQFGGTCFTNLSSLNVSSNRLSNLPRELVHCKQLTSVDISSNNFVEIPSVLLEIETITDINAKSNFIAEVNDDEIENHETLEMVNLENNPLTTSCHERLRRISNIRIIVSEKKLEEWEDLSI